VSDELVGRRRILRIETHQACRPGRTLAPASIPVSPNSVGDITVEVVHGAEAVGANDAPTRLNRDVRL